MVKFSIYRYKPNNGISLDLEEMHNIHAICVA